MVRENLEMLKLWKSRNNFFKFLKSGRGIVNSFSANLRCLNFEMFWESTSPPKKNSWACCNTFSSWASGKVMEKFWDSLEELFYIHPVI